MASLRLRKTERHKRILDEIRMASAIRVSGLAKALGVAGETIRRDLVELGEAGLVNRTYGGATVPLHGAEPFVAERGLLMVEERARIAAAAAELVENGQSVMLDGGSTTFEVARELAQWKRDLVVITNSFAVASVAGGNPTLRVILCPGAYERREGAVLGEETVEFLGRFNAHVAVIGATGVMPAGPCESAPGAAAVKRAMIRSAPRVVLVVTHDKFGRAGQDVVCPFGALADVVCDADPSPAYRESLRQAGVALTVARPEAGA